MMRRLCAWCRKDLDTGKQLSEEEYKTASLEATHGMCPECYKKATGLQYEAQEKFIPPTYKQIKEYYRLFGRDHDSSWDSGEIGRRIRQGQGQR